MCNIFLSIELPYVFLLDHLICLYLRLLLIGIYLLQFLYLCSSLSISIYLYLYIEREGVFSNILSILCSLSSSGSCMIQMLLCLILSQRILRLHYLKFSFLFVALLGWLLLSCPLNWWFDLLIYVTWHWFWCILNFRYCILYFWLVIIYGLYVLCNVYYLFFKFSLRSFIISVWYLSIFITTVLNSAYDILVTSISFNFFSGISFVLSFGAYFFLLILSLFIR